MRRRLAIIVSVLALTACSDSFYAPTGVAGQRNIDDRTTSQGEYCYGFASDDIKSLIPFCASH